MKFEFDPKNSHKYGETSKNLKKEDDEINLKSQDAPGAEPVTAPIGRFFPIVHCLGTHAIWTLE